MRRINKDRKDGDLEAFSLKKFLRPAADLKIWGFAMIFLSVSPVQILPIIYHATQTANKL